jgi:hypothetical protein
MSCRAPRRSGPDEEVTDIYLDEERVVVHGADLGVGLDGGGRRRIEHRRLLPRRRSDVFGRMRRGLRKRLGCVIHALSVALGTDLDEGH